MGTQIDENLESDTRMSHSDDEQGDFDAETKMDKIRALTRRIVRRVDLALNLC